MNPSRSPARAVLALLLLSACPHTDSTLSGPSGIAVALSQNGQQVSTWPPSGEGCAQAVSCCEAMWATRPEMELACKLAAVRHSQNGRSSCQELSSTVMAIWTELGNPTLPGACQR